MPLRGGCHDGTERSSFITIDVRVDVYLSLENQLHLSQPQLFSSDALVVVNL